MSSRDGGAAGAQKPKPLARSTSSNMMGGHGHAHAPPSLHSGRTFEHNHGDESHPAQCPGKQYLSPPRIAEKVCAMTSTGAVGGFRRVDGGAITFRGIPFAASTAGQNRWKGPQPVAPWEGERDCTLYGEAVTQNEVAMSKGNGGAPPGGDIGKMGDECLNVNVVTPALGGKAPVMVWIHGGSNMMGSNNGDSFGASPTFGDSWADMGVVACAVNYRIALHGFMHLPELGVTNLALRDLIAGLTWVRDEIAAFGGDPSNVTVFGQSAGAINICSLLCSPKAKGLFRRAIVQSGGLSFISLDDYNKLVYPEYQDCVKPFLPRGKGKAAEWSLESLSALSADDVYHASTHYKEGLMMTHGVAKSPTDYHTVADGDVIPEDPLAYLADGGCEGVEVIIGAGHHEASMLVAFMGSLLCGTMVFPSLLPMGVRGQLGFTKAAEAGMPRGALAALCRDFQARLQATLDGRQTWMGASDADALGKAASWVFGCGGVACVGLAEALVAGGAAVRAYEIRLSASESPKWGNGHCIDLPLLFKPEDDGETKFLARVFLGLHDFADAHRSYVRGMRAAWTDFAKGAGASPDFGYAGVPWPAFPKCMTIGPAPSAEGPAPFARQSPICKAWAAALEANGFRPLPKRDPKAQESCCFAFC